MRFLLPTALVLIGSGLAQADDMTGRWSISGRYDGAGVSTQADLVISRTVRGLRVERTGRYLGNANRHIPGFSWVCQEATRLGPQRWRAVYQVGTGGTGFSGFVGGNRVTSDCTNVFVADYTRVGSTIMETLVNASKQEPHHWWSSLQASGRRLATTRTTVYSVPAGGGVHTSNSTQVILSTGGSVIQQTQTTVFGSGNTTFTISETRSHGSRFGTGHVYRGNSRLRNQGHRARSGISITFGSGGTTIGHHTSHGLSGKPLLRRR